MLLFTGQAASGDPHVHVMFGHVMVGHVMSNVVRLSEAVQSGHKSASGCARQRCCWTNGVGSASIAVQDTAVH
jgi:hypothetical protein